MTDDAAMWLWEPTLLLRWRQADPAHAIIKTLVLEQLWRGRQVDDGVVDPRHPTRPRPRVPYEMREEWREVPVVEGERHD